MDINEPITRAEAILSGEDLEPMSRIEYFLKKAANEVPKPSEVGAGSVIAVNEFGEYVLKPQVLAQETGPNTVCQAAADDDVPNVASGLQAIAFGTHSTASGVNSFAIGSTGIASGDQSFVLGTGGEASGRNSVAGGSIHTSGSRPTASGTASFAFGAWPRAVGNLSVAFGQNTEANATASTTFGDTTKATGRSQFVVGAYNAEDDNPVDSSHGSGARKYLFIVGNGVSSQRSNALTVDWDGNVEAQGGVTLGKGTANEATLTPSQLLNRSKVWSNNSSLFFAPSSGITGVTKTIRAYYSGGMLHIAGTIGATTVDSTDDNRSVWWVGTNNDTDPDFLACLDCARLYGFGTNSQNMLRQLNQVSGSSEAIFFDTTTGEVITTMWAKVYLIYNFNNTGWYWIGFNNNVTNGGATRGFHITLPCPEDKIVWPVSN